MEQIPLNSFRILNKKFGWEKSLSEIINDDVNDSALFRESIKSSQEIFINSDTNKLGAWEGSAENISKIWLQYFFLQLRFNVKTLYIVTGIKKRGIPKSEAVEHITYVDNLRKKLDELFFTSTYVHLMFMFAHLHENESHIGKQEFFDLLFEEKYLYSLRTAYEIALEHSMFSKKSVDLEIIERKLRLQWIGDFKELWNSQEESD